MGVLANFPIITITREYGAGGRSLARALSKKYDIPWHDADIVKLASDISGYTEEEIEAEGQELSKLDRALDWMLNSSVAYTSSRDQIYKAQAESILELAKEPCIFISRCSNIILRNAGVPSFDIFLYADLEKRVERAKELREHGEENIHEYMKKRDNLRKIYYETYTKKKFGDCDDYDMFINTGLLKYEDYADLIDISIKNKYGL